MKCKLCEKFYQEHPLTDGKHIISSDKNLKVLMTPIRCGFKNGVFTRNNWNCQTLIKLRQIAESIIWDDKPHPFAVGYHRDDFNSASIAIIQIPEPESDDIQTGYIVLTWYKDRGKTGNAIVICDDYDIEPLTLKTAEWVIEKSSPQCEVAGQVKNMKIKEKVFKEMREDKGWKLLTESPYREGLIYKTIDLAIQKTLEEVEKIIIKPSKRAKILTGNNEEVLGFILKKDWEKIKGEKG